jgi:ketosteroid isomerase-like protein
MTARSRTARVSTAKAKAEVSEAATRLEAAMRKLHDGRWVTTLDHRARFILIRQRFPKPKGARRA